MHYYNNSKQEIFFEEKRFNENNLPKWKDIEFISPYIYKELKIKMGKDDEQISLNDWNKLKPYLYFDEKNYTIPTLRREAMKNNNKMLEKFKEGKIKLFEKFKLEDDKTILDKTKEINVNTYSSMYEYFLKGHHIGMCGEAAKLISVLFDNPEFHTKGNAAPLKGTKNSVDGVHAWIEAKIDGVDYIVDTSLMALIPVELKEELEYKDIRKPETLQEMKDEDDLVYDHYEESKKHTTKDKASYDNYCEKVKELEEKAKKSKEKNDDEYCL